MSETLGWLLQPASASAASGAMVRRIMGLSRSFARRRDSPHIRA
ncbi:MAG: hypothetical protein WDN24_08965 [Sphingomonas sp.]